MQEPWVNHPTTLNGIHIDLLPLQQEHFDDLFKAASDKRIWEFYTGDWSVHKRFVEIYTESMEQRDKGLEYPFVVFHKPAQSIIGSTRLLDIYQPARRLEIGGTWLMPEYWATSVNLDCKLALLTFCFETLDTNRVQLKTQHNNIRSQKAIQKIGGIYEGILREHMLKDDGTFRSSAYFSILKSEWPELKIRLSDQLHGMIAKNPS
jgi:RimJ/RimL family protein N-acetyltransferase